MTPTKVDYQKFLSQQQVTHAFTFKPNNPGRPKALIPIRIVQETGEAVTIDCSHVANRYLMAPVINTDRLRVLFARAMTYLNRALLGSHYHRPALAARRISAIAVCEGLPSEGHLHGFLNAPEDLWPKIATIFPDKRERVVRYSERAAPDPWSTISPGGTSVVTLVIDQPGWARYVTKEANLPDFANKILFYPNNIE